MTTRTEILRDVPLASYTTLGLGGPAQRFAPVAGLEQLRTALIYALENQLPVCILGGGSNLVFADEGYAGLVIRLGMRGITMQEEGPSVYVSAAAGEPWDDLVQACVDHGLAGIECLSGIPGSVGATPIQNVGAYGQEVSETIVALTALDRRDLQVVEFAGDECGFGYRRSRFKGPDRGRYVVTAVTYRLCPNGRPRVRYPELARYLEDGGDLAGLADGRPALQAVRKAVLGLRRRKSMLYDPNDPYSRSVGSFFLNPVLSAAQWQRLEERWRGVGGDGPIPSFDTPDGVKVPAAWLVEQAGFERGYLRGGVGISVNHALALVNYAGTTRELLKLAAEIREGVADRFGVHLEIEPEVVPYAGE